MPDNAPQGLSMAAGYVSVQDFAAQDLVIVVHDPAAPVIGRFSMSPKTAASLAAQIVGALECRL